MRGVCPRGVCPGCVLPGGGVRDASPPLSRVTGGGGGGSGGPSAPGFSSSSFAESTARTYSPHAFESTAIGWPAMVRERRSFSSPSKRPACRHTHTRGSGARRGCARAGKLGRDRLARDAPNVRLVEEIAELAA